MIELTTGVVFLMSSLYGSGQPQTMAMSDTATKGESTSSISSTLKRIDAYDPTEVQKYLKKEFSGRQILVDVARCESNFNQYDKSGKVLKGIVDRADIGIMQINERYHGETAKKLGYDIYTIEGNIEYAKHLYDKEGTKPWSASKSCWSKVSELAMK